MGTLITTGIEFLSALDNLRDYSALVVDTETTGLTPFRRESPDRLCSIQIGPAFKHTTEHDYYFPFRHEEGENLSLAFLQPLRDLLRGKTLMGHNLGFDIRFLTRDGFELPPTILDSLTASHMSNELAESHALKKISAVLFGDEAVGDEAALAAELRRRRFGKGDISKLPASLVAPYGLADIALTRRLHADRLVELERWRLLDLYYERCEFLRELIRMELRGILLDQGEVAKQRELIGPLIAQYGERLREMSGGINLNSPQQVAKWLNVPNTARPFLEELLAREPREDIQLLLDYRQLLKAETGFFTPYSEMADDTSRLHTSYRIAGTWTWRLSSSEPNLQQCSRDQDDRLYSVRSCFRASPGHFLVEMDYSTIEPRLAAHYSQDENMLGAFLKGHDYHSTIARTMYHKQEITKDERTSAKALGLGILYGLGANKAARKLGLRHRKDSSGHWCDHHTLVWAFSPEGALTQYPCSVVDPEFCTAAGRGYIAQYHEAVPELQPSMWKVRNKAAEIGYIRVPLTGAVQRFGPTRSPYKSYNALIQCSASEILRRALTKVGKMCTSESDPKLLLTVHDSLLLEVPYSDQAMDQVRAIKHIMETCTPISVPTPVDLKIGETWGNLGGIQL